MHNAAALQQEGANGGKRDANVNRCTATTEIQGAP